MQLKDIKTNTVTRYVADFKGLNKLPVVESGEVSESTNITFENYPVMKQRLGRYNVSSFTVGTPLGIVECGSGKYAYVLYNSTVTPATCTLYYCSIIGPTQTATGLTTLSNTTKSMVYFNGKIFIFPDCKYYDIAGATYGDIGTGTYPAEGSCPPIDYACVHNNRIWGVSGSYIYASALGYALGAAGSNGICGWAPPGDSNDTGGYYAGVGSSGDFTGIISWDDKIVALKQNIHYEVSGNYPSNYAISTISKVGTTNHDSIKEVQGKLIYASESGIQGYGGSFENNISRKLNEVWTGIKPVAGSDGIHYYLSCLISGVQRLYVYNAMNDMWTEEDPIDVVQFMTLDGYVYAMTANGVLRQLGVNSSSEVIEWSFTFSDYAEDVYIQTVIPKLVLKLKGEEGTSVNIKMSVDGGKYELLRNFTLEDDSMHSIKMGIKRGQEHTFQVSGAGAVTIYGYQFIYQNGGENIV